MFYETTDAMKANGMQQGEQLQLLLSLLPVAAETCLTSRAPLMAAAGYEYINVDGGWWSGSDTGTIGRNASGYFEYNTIKYPRGIRAVADYIHKAGFK